MIKRDLGNIELFGENLYAVHSIEYKRLESYYYIFAVRHLDKWLSWEEVKFYAALFDFPAVPELAIAQVKDLSPATLEKQVIDWAKEPSIFGSRDTLTEQDCTCEGIVTRNMLAYPVTAGLFKQLKRKHVPISGKDRILSGMPQTSPG